LAKRAKYERILKLETERVEHEVLILEMQLQREREERLTNYG
jgi:hypothetical protein